MCLIKRFKSVKEANTFKPLKAKKDIVVWKALTISGLSVFRHRRYKPGGLAKVKNLGIKTKGRFIEVNKGLHSFSTISGAKNEAYPIEMIIPKGAYYIKGKFRNYDSYASTQLFWPKPKKNGNTSKTKVR